MNGTALDSLIKKVRDEFIIAKSDGKLDAGEIIQIAMIVAQGVQVFGVLSGSEKKAVVMMALKRGFDAAGGLPGLEGATSEAVKSMESQLFSAASAAIDVAVAAAHGKIDFRKPAAWKACFPLCAAAAAVLLPKDQHFLREALQYAAGEAVPSIQEYQTPSAPIHSAQIALHSKEGMTPLQLDEKVGNLRPSLAKGIESIEETPEYRPF